MRFKAVGRFLYDGGASAAVSADGIIPLPNSTISGNAFTNNNGIITISKPGLYLILGEFTFTATAEGTQETKMYRNGIAATGVSANDTVAANDIVSQSLNGLVSVECRSSEIITFRSTSATSLDVANVKVIKIA